MTIMVADKSGDLEQHSIKSLSQMYTWWVIWLEMDFFLRKISISMFTMSSISSRNGI